MTHELRDMLAASALQGLASRARTVGVLDDVVALGREAYRMADGALIAREEPPAAAPAPQQQRPQPGRRPVAGPQRQQAAPPPAPTPPVVDNGEQRVGGPPPGFQGFKQPPGQ